MAELTTQNLYSMIEKALQNCGSITCQVELHSCKVEKLSASVAKSQVRSHIICMYVTMQAYVVTQKAVLYAFKLYFYYKCKDLQWSPLVH